MLKTLSVLLACCVCCVNVAETAGDGKGEVEEELVTLSPLLTTPSPPTQTNSGCHKGKTDDRYQ